MKILNQIVDFRITWGTTSIFEMASGYEINASPDPLFTTLEISVTPKLWAKLPRMAKIVMPPNKLVNVSIEVTITASLELRQYGYIAC